MAEVSQVNFLYPIFGKPSQDQGQIIVAGGMSRQGQVAAKWVGPLGLQVRQDISEGTSPHTVHRLYQGLGWGLPTREEVTEEGNGHLGVLCQAVLLAALAQGCTQPSLSP